MKRLNRGRSAGLQTGIAERSDAKLTNAIAPIAHTSRGRRNE